MAESTKKRPERKGAWWRKYTKEFLEEPQPIPVEKPAEAKPQKKIIFPRFETHDPFEDIARIQKEMDRTFKETFSRGFFGIPMMNFPRIVKLKEGVFRKPAVEVRDLGKAIAVRAEIPGVKKENIKIRLEGRNLIIDASSQKKHESQTAASQSFSQSFSGFRNVIRLPTDIEKKSIRAKYENGILTVILQKKENSDESGDIELD